MKSLFGKYIWLQLILSILLLFGGALIIVFVATGEEGVLQTALNIIATVILFLFGIFTIVAAFVFEPKKVFTNGLLYGSASVAFGIFLLTKEIVLLDYIVKLLAIFFIVVGGIELIKAIVLTVIDRSKLAPIIITYIVSAIFIAIGILALLPVSFRDIIEKGFSILAGVLLVAAGIYQLVLGIIQMIGSVKKAPIDKTGAPAKKKEKKTPTKKEPKEGAVVADVKADEVPEEKEPEIKELDYTETKALEQK
ncbi:MAG: hypothetical protein GXY27_00200 [Erysipelotrichaceae bacterium]|nr:hypothetical protein [Erysipelotrichaceae bacterium]